MSIPAAVVVYLIVLRTLSIMPMVDPELTSRLVEKVPHRMRPLICRVLNVPSPPAKGPAEPE